MGRNDKGLQPERISSLPEQRMELLKMGLQAVSYNACRSVQLEFKVKNQNTSGTEIMNTEE